MPNGFFTPQSSSRSTRELAGAYVNRQSRFDARQTRRRGDWFILDVPTPVLWMENPWLPVIDEALACDEAVIVDLWP